MNKEAKSRHGCLTAVLIILIVSSLLTVTILVVFSGNVEKTNPNFTTSMLILEVCTTALELFAIYLLFKWKKIGFFLIGIAYLFDLYISDRIGTLNINVILGMIIRFGVLYGVLLIKSKGVSGWKNLTE